MLKATLPFFLTKVLLDINLLELPEDIGTATGVGTFAGGILLTLCILFTFISLPIYKKNVTAVLILSILILGFAIVVQWLNIFFLIIIILIIALGITDKAVGIFKGRL